MAGEERSGQSVGTVCTDGDVTGGRARWTADVTSAVRQVPPNNTLHPAAAAIIAPTVMLFHYSAPYSVISSPHILQSRSSWPGTAYNHLRILTNFSSKS